MLARRAGEEDHSHVRIRTRDAPRRCNRIEARHADVDHDQVWLVVAGELDGLRPVEGLCDDDDVGAPQRAAQRAARGCSVVGDDRSPLGSPFTEALHSSNATEFRKLTLQAFARTSDGLTASSLTSTSTTLRLGSACLSFVESLRTLYRLNPAPTGGELRSAPGEGGA